ncbi:hypothetical protein evm_013349 [Chilo suppressalis]|nr:hypothetical protein evm_013349 [Chilo suppressalis]
MAGGAGGDVQTARAGAEGEAMLQGLRAATNYSVWVRARSGPGLGPPAPPVYCHTREDGNPPRIYMSRCRGCAPPPTTPCGLIDDDDKTLINISIVCTGAVPGPPEAIRALAASADSVHVTWLPPADYSGRITHYMLYTRELGKVGGEWSQRVEPGEAGGGAEEECWREVSGLRERTVYEFWARAATPAGAGPPCRAVTAAPAKPGKKNMNNVTDNGLPRCNMPWRTVSGKSSRRKYRNKDDENSVKKYRKLANKIFLKCREYKQKNMENYCEMIDHYMKHGKVDKTYNIIRYADDIAAVTETPEDLEDILKTMDSNFKKNSLNINVKKTKNMTTSEFGIDFERPITLNNTILETVNKFRYLGSFITPDSRCTPDIRARIALAKQNFLNMKQIFSSKISKEIRKKFIKTYCWSIALYGCETWTMTHRDRCGAGEGWKELVG